MEHILVFGGSVTLLHYLNHQQDIKYTVILSTKDDYNSKYLKKAEEVHVIDYTDYKKIRNFISYIIEKNKISGVMCLTDSDIPLAAKIAKEFNFYYITEESARIALDKELMRKKLNNISDFKVEYSIVKDILEVESTVRENNGTCFILKPICGAGSSKVTKICGVMDARLLFNRNIITKDDFPLIMEEFLEGKEFSVETFSIEGQHYIIGITEKIKDSTSFIEYGHIFPDETLDIEQVREIEQFTKKVLNYINLKDGPSHTEIIYTKTGPRLIETHTRFGGDNIPSLIKHSTGIDLPDAMFDLFIRKKIPQFCYEPISYNKVTSIRYFQLKEGYLEDIYGVEEVRKLENVIDINIDISPGSYVTKDNDSFDRKGYVIICGESREQNEEVWKMVCSNINFIIRKGDKID